MPHRPHRRLAAWAAGLLALGAAWTAGGFWAAPGLLRRAAIDLVRERLHRELTIEAIRVDPLRLRISIDGLKLPDTQGGTMVAWRHAALELAPLRSLVRRAPVFPVVQVEGLQLQATIGADSRFNLADLALLAGPDEGDKTPARYLVDQLHVDGDSLRFSQRDRPRAFTLHADRLQLDATGFGTVGTPRNALRLAVRTDAGETLEAEGRLQPDPLRAELSVGLKALQATTLARYLDEALPFDVARGTLALDAQVELAATDQGPLQLKGRLAKFELKDTALRARSGTQNLLQLRGISATGGSIDLAAHRAALDRLAVDGLLASIRRDASGRVNLAALFPPDATPSGPASADLPGWQWQLNEFALTGGELSMEDGGIKPAVRVNAHEVALKLGGLSQDAARPLGVELAMRIEGSGRLSSQGRFRPDTLAYTGHVEASRIDLRPAQPYLQQEADLRLLSGQLGFALDVDASPARTQLRGEAEVRDLRTVDNVLKQDFLQWKRLRARDIEYDSQPRQTLHIRELSADAPYARVIVGADRSLNLTQVLREPAAPAAATAPQAPAPPAAAPGLDIAIDVVRINKASANFADLWIEPHFAVGIQELGGTIKGLSSQEGSRATVDLKGAVDRYAPVVISGEINPLSAALFSDISMSFSNVDLTSVTPYSGRFAGYEIRKGKLSADLRYHIKARTLDATHHLVVDQFELGDHVESADATTLPVRLAVALLKDRHGVIDVQLPVSGNLDDPQFRLGPLVWKMVVNLVVKVVTSPFTLLGNLFGGGEDLNQVTFIPGTAQLDDAGRQRAEALRKAMVERPGLRLDLPTGWSAEFDRPAMLRRQLEAQLAEVAPQAGTDRYAQLVAAWREEAGSKAPLPGKSVAELESALLARYVVGDEELEDLGRRRAQAVQEVLFANQDVDPVRVFVVDGKPAGADPQQIRLDLLLK